MKLTVLGGSAASVSAGQGCSGYLVSHGETTVVADLGPNTLIELRKHTDYRKLSAIVISHLHVDHLIDLFALRFALAYNPIRPERPVPLFLPPEGERFLRAVAAPIAAMEGYEDYFTDFTISEYDPEQSLQIGEINIAFHPTIHALPTWAMRFTGTDDTRAFVYTADTGPTADLAPFARDAHVLLSEATYGIDLQRERQHDIRIHMTVGEATRLAIRANAHTLIFTHTFPESAPDDYAEEARKSFPGDVYLARPGLIIDWDTERV